MYKVSEDLTKITRAEQFNSVEFNGYLMGEDSPPELLPRTIDLNAYTARINEMYDTQIIRGTRVDYRVPLAQRLASPKEDPVAGERGCSSYYDPKTKTIQFTPIIHGQEGSVTRESFDLIRQSKLPILEMHTHPEDQLFSPEDYATILMSVGASNVRFMKATLLLCPSNQVLALASSETAKYNRSELEKMLNEWNIQHNIELDQIFKLAVGREETESAQFEQAIEQLKKLVGSGEITADQALKSGAGLLRQSNDATLRNDPIDIGKIAQKQNQGLLGFALSNGIKLYFSTDRKTFKEFSA